MASRRSPRKQPKQERSRELVDAVLVAVGELAAERGLEGLTSPEIARRSGVASASIYEYFPTKDAIIAAWAERSWERAFEAAATRIQLNVAEKLSVGDGVAAVVRSLNGELRPFAKAFRTCRFEWHVGRPERRAELTDAVASMVLGAFANAPAVAAASRVADAKVGARVVATVFCGDTYTDLLASDEDPEAIDAAVASMVSLFITGGG